MERIKKVGVSVAALLMIFVLLGIAATTGNFLEKRTGYQIITPWTPPAGIFGQKSISIPSAGQAGLMPYTEQPTQTAAEKALTPEDMQYYVNGIFIPKPMIGEIQLSKDIMRTYEGKFGPYPFNPMESLVIKICSQNIYESDPPTCEQIISTSFINQYIVFGYANDYDEYIGYYPREKFTTYFEVYTKDGKFLKKSNVGKVRMVYSD